MIKKIVYIIIILVSYTFSNPISIKMLNELKFNTSGWLLELRNDEYLEIENLDGWFLTSLTDTAFFNNNISFGLDTFIVITQDSLLSQFAIDVNYDEIWIHNPYYGEVDRLIFGEIVQWSIASPELDQSINRPPFGFTDDFIYLDNSPTIGFDNDFIGAIGNVEGIVSDTFQVPIVGVMVLYNIDYGGLSPDSSYVITNDNGYYTFSYIARVKNVRFIKNGFETTSHLVQVYPDSVINVIQELIGLMQSVVDDSPNIVNRYIMDNNYPNPFNSTTTINYYIPQDGMIEISIYSISGQLIKVLDKEIKSQGKHRQQFNFGELSSGVYIIQLKSDEITISKKCIYLK